ncbi:hypothetical protein J2797_005143 [Paraburkholderia terricola]|uniref:hypothetical protein n=1 Tax=Paraburkholderia terricola TaxID=169427 RepID=UPI002864610F|nr:hypothetical protein [Paraburkholderia terricola]MDR6495227.1 hypothetical protein [Paraburkholderia terricola]
MESASYKGYRIFGHAILQQEDILSAGLFAGSGTITRDTKMVETSGVLGVFDTEEAAELAGLDWARAWVDSHGA